MNKFEFTVEGKVYELGEDNCEYFVNDEEKCVEGIDLPQVLALFKEQ